MSKILGNICVLATEHNVCRAYLGQLDDLGLVPEQILYFQRTKPDGVRIRARSIARHVRNRLRSAVSPSRPQPIQKLPAAVRKRFLGLLKDYCVKQSFSIPDFECEMDDIIVRYDSVRHVESNQINSETVIRALADCPQEFVVFCGGGILRREILSLPKRFIHIHPGVVPDVKGADGILWSSLVRRKIGMSAFFMNEGIDTGDILKTQEYDIPRLFEFPTNAASRWQLSNFIVNFVDPVFRAKLLSELFENNSDPGKWTTTIQNPLDGKVYYFMHDAVKQHSLRPWHGDSTR